MASISDLPGFGDTPLFLVGVSQATGKATKCPTDEATNG
jgi:hypothetical protein